MAEDLLFLEIHQPESAEFEAYLKHTLDTFSESTLTEEEMPLIRFETIHCIRKVVQIRQVLSQREDMAETLDQREVYEVANQAYAQLELVEYDEETGRYISPSGLVARMNDQDITYDMVVERKYKEAFRSFFEKHHYLVERYRLNDSGWLYNNINAELSTDEYCNVIISEMTTKWVRRLLYSPTNDIIISYEMELGHDFLNGYKAVTARWAMAMIEDEEVEEYAKHMKIIISLSTYLCVLDSVFHKIGICGYDLIRDTYGQD